MIIIDFIRRKPMNMDLFDTLKISIENFKTTDKFEIKEMRENLEKIEGRIKERYKNIIDKFEIFPIIPHQYGQALGNVLQNLNVFINEYQYSPYAPDINILKNEFKKFNSNLDTIEILERLAITKNNIVVIGANGSGKSSLVSFLKESYLSNMIVIPAQKILVYHSGSSTIYLKSKKDVNEYQNQDFISSLKREITHLDSAYSYSFTIMITAIVNDYVEQILKIHDGDKSTEENCIIFNQLKRIWNILLPHIELSIDANYRLIYPSSNGIRYDINSLSDGEKSILYYVGNILMANPDSYIIIDEPETFLNPAIYNKLWDLLIEERQDCQFIFCSHTVDFISSRVNTSIVWSKKFESPNHWELEVLPNTSLPPSILVELLGSRKKILFCEGDDKHSLDFKIYSSLFMEQYNIFPSGGHSKVMEYVSSFNSLDGLHHNSAIGIIDGDLSLNNGKDEYEKNNIYTLPFNEIEMFLLTDEVMEACLQSFMKPEEAKGKIKTFKKKFFAEVEKHKEKIALARIKKIIDIKLANYRIQNQTSISELQKEYEKLNTLVDIREEYTQIVSLIDTCLVSKDYITLLKICNLKEQISKGIANSHLDSKYIDKAIFKIQSDFELKQKLKESYFSDLIE